MSGGGGGGYDVGGGGGGVMSCDALGFVTILNSPKADVIKTLKVGDTLKVVALGPKGPAVAQTAAGREAGSITSGLYVKLLDCLAQGYHYKATVQKISGGSCEVKVEVQ